MTSTPRLDSVRQWLAGDLSAPIEWPEPRRFPDPHAGMTMPERICAAIHAAASGAPAFTTVERIITGPGGRVPPPPSRRPRSTP
jgi:hypothetical protein